MADIAVNNTRVLYDQTPSFSSSGPWVHCILMMAPNGTLYLRENYDQYNIINTTLQGMLENNNGAEGNFTLGLTLQ
jgi:hypothetical protein